MIRERERCIFDVIFARITPLISHYTNAVRDGDEDEKLYRKCMSQANMSHSVVFRIIRKNN